MERGMIKTLMFDLGGTLHTVKRTPASRLRFCAHLIDILGRHGIPVTLSPQELDAMLAVNGEEYKHFGERHLVELPQSVIWSKYFLKELHIDEARLAPFAEEMSFLYDQERMENIPRPQLRETMEALHGMGIRLGVISNIISTTLVPYALKEYGIDSSDLRDRHGRDARRPGGDGLRGGHYLPGRAGLPERGAGPVRAHRQPFHRPPGRGLPGAGRPEGGLRDP